MESNHRLFSLVQSLERIEGILSAQNDLVEAKNIPKSC